MKFPCSRSTTLRSGNLDNLSLSAIEHLNYVYNWLLQSIVIWRQLSSSNFHQLLCPTGAIWRKVRALRVNLRWALTPQIEKQTERGPHKTEIDRRCKITWRRQCAARAKHRSTPKPLEAYKKPAAARNRDTSRVETTKTDCPSLHQTKDQHQAIQPI